MATSLRIVLVASALIVLLFMMGKMKKSQMKAMDAVFWLLFSLSFVVLAAFPQIAGVLASFLGFQAASNFVFVYVIAILVVHDFASLFSLSFVVLAAFPQIAGVLASFLGFQAASNFVFVYVIAILVVHDFASTVKYACLRDRFDLLVEEIALRNSSRGEKMQ